MKDWMQRIKASSGKLAKFKYPALVLLLGLVLLLLPGRKKEDQQTTANTVEETSVETADSPEEYCAAVEASLSKILSKIDGAGKVEVMLTLKSGWQTNYQTDYDTTTDNDGDRVTSTTTQKTVILSQGSAYDEGAVVKTDYPSFQGALVVSEGGKDPTVKLQIIRAVSALLGLGTENVTVVKMK